MGITISSNLGYRAILTLPAKLKYLTSLCKLQGAKFDFDIASN